MIREKYMISRNLKRDDLIGKKCRTLCDIENGGGQGVSEGNVCTIKDVVRGHGFAIRTDKCPYCGQYAYITHVGRNQIELL